VPVPATMVNGMSDVALLRRPIHWLADRDCSEMSAVNYGNTDKKRYDTVLQLFCWT